MPLDDFPTAGSARPAAGADMAARSAMSLVATVGRPGELLQHLHLQAVERVAGRSAILFRHNPRNGALQATSGFGLDSLRTDPWSPLGEEATIVESAFEKK